MRTKQETDRCAHPGCDKPHDDETHNVPRRPAAPDWRALAATAYCRTRHPTHSVTCDLSRAAADIFLAAE